MAELLDNGPFIVGVTGCLCFLSSGFHYRLDQLIRIHRQQNLFRRPFLRLTTRSIAGFRLVQHHHSSLPCFSWQP
jgi:hypothetical protein